MSALRIRTVKRKVTGLLAVTALAASLLVAPPQHNTAEAGIFGGAIGGALIGGVVGGRGGMIGGAIIGGVVGGVAKANQDRRYRYRRQMRRRYR